MFPISGAKLTIRCLCHDLFLHKNVEEIVKFNNDKNSFSLGRPLMTNQPTVGAQGNIQPHKNRHACYRLSCSSNDDGSVVHKLIQLRFSKGHRARCFLGDLRLPSPYTASFQAFCVRTDVFCAITSWDFSLTFREFESMLSSGNVPRSARSFRLCKRIVHISPLFISCHHRRRNSAWKALRNLSEMLRGKLLQTPGYR